MDVAQQQESEAGARFSGSCEGTLSAVGEAQANVFHTPGNPGQFRAAQTLPDKWRARQDSNM
jgi:hypothetical protein